MVNVKDDQSELSQLGNMLTAQLHSQSACFVMQCLDKIQPENRRIHERICCMLGGSSQDSDTWLITMVIISPLRIGLWDPFQMAFPWLINGGDPNYLRQLGWSSKWSCLFVHGRPGCPTGSQRPSGFSKSATLRSLSAVEALLPAGLPCPPLAIMYLLVSKAIRTRSCEHPWFSADEIGHRGEAPFERCREIGRTSCFSIVPHRRHSDWPREVGSCYRSVAYSYKCHRSGSGHDYAGLEDFRSVFPEDSVFCNRTPHWEIRWFTAKCRGDTRRQMCLCWDVTCCTCMSTRISSSVQSWRQAWCTAGWFPSGEWEHIGISA